MGVGTVAVFSEADRNALHVTLADEAMCIGPPPAKDSYLDAGAIIAAARETRAEAVHPGYGFLSENAAFAQSCADAGLLFVGPSAETIRVMGSKAQAKARMQAAGVPIVPGYHGADQSARAMREAAERIGYPVLIKASAGGGGRGMRRVDTAGDLEDALASARREAKAAFGDDALLIEKYIVRARHIEIQVLGDTHGSVVTLYERECTLQRRHQKVVEEAPSVAVTPARRTEMSAAACAAAAAVGYVNAGTVEFIADAGRFYFIEMNTRLQVEHPVTEMITGLDLVEWQLRVACGERLPLGQHEIHAKGHAIEARVYAEDPDKGFLPAAGTIRHWRAPAGEGVRVDTGFRAGDTVTPYYDSLLAKLIVWGEDRGEALRRMHDALGAFEIAGVTTNLAFLQALLARPEVASGNIDTGLIERELSALTRSQRPVAARDVAAACAAVLLRERAGQKVRPLDSPWNRSDGWMLAGRRARRLSFRRGSEHWEATLSYERSHMSLEFAGRRDALRATPGEGASFEVGLGEAAERASAAWAGRDLHLSTPRGPLALHWTDPFAGDGGESAGGGRIVAPMPGTVTRILATAGAQVARGAPLLVLEAMKMEHTLRAPADGRLEALRCAVGDVVQEGAELADFVPAAQPD
jgi:3-methylcrotonyl-CoA carboxylase alpha subunit